MVLSLRTAVVVLSPSSGAKSAVLKLSLTIKAVLDYLEATREYAITMTNSCLPCMIILVFGSFCLFLLGTMNNRIFNRTVYCFRRSSLESASTSPDALVRPPNALSLYGHGYAS